ncbi:hypothetical protein AHiyo4_34910 [Arthrobacter sp. Hiyo4]|nr:hypothetical protein AHiyo4_34910 [Arthrobacter sp. Hiyo4]
MRSKNRETVAFEGTFPNTPGWERRMSRSDAYSPPAASITASDPSSRPGRCEAIAGTNWPSRSSHKSRNPRASINDVRILAPAWETSDWPVKETGTEGKTLVDWGIEKVLLQDTENNGVDTPIFPCQTNSSDRCNTP